MYVFTVTKEQRPLMPTTPAKARRMVASGRATPFWKKGVFCIRINYACEEKTQPIAVGIDPGSKKEGYSIMSAAHTYLNIQADAVTWVKKHLELRSVLRRGRRGRKTPYRKCRWNRKIGGIPPSTKARWQWKLRILRWLAKIIPITDVIIEDIKARTLKGKAKWNITFSPLEVGKQWFYGKIKQLWCLHIFQGYETYEMRTKLGLKKLGNKMAVDFHAHCVDAWVLANAIIGNKTIVDNANMLLITPLQLHRRQLHATQPGKNGKRRNYGGTRSMGFKRGDLVEHPKWGITYVGGNMRGNISLHSVKTGKRLCQNVKSNVLKFLTHCSWRTHSSHG